MHTDPSAVLTLLLLPYGRVWDVWLRTKDLCKVLAASVSFFAFLWLDRDQVGVAATRQRLAGEIMLASSDIISETFRFAQWLVVVSTA